MRRFSIPLLLVVGLLAFLAPVRIAGAFTPWQPVIAIPCCHTGAPSTWDATYNPSICPSGTPCVTFSGGNDIWTCTNCASGYLTNGRGTNNHPAGKWHFEITTTTVASACCYEVGLVSSAVGNAVAIDNSADGVGYSSTGAVYLNNPTTIGTVAAYTSGSIVCVEVDLNNKLLWVRVGSGGTWNNSGTANPATGAGGLNIATVTTTNLYPGVSTGYGAGAATLNVGATSFNCPVSSGFNSWG